MGYPKLKKHCRTRYKRSLAALMQTVGVVVQKKNKKKIVITVSNGCVKDTATGCIARHLAAIAPRLENL